MALPSFKKIISHNNPSSNNNKNNNNKNSNNNNNINSESKSSLFSGFSLTNQDSNHSNHSNHSTPSFFDPLEEENGTTQPSSPSNNQNQNQNQNHTANTFSSSTPASATNLNLMSLNQLNQKSLPNDIQRQERSNSFNLKKSCNHSHSLTPLNKLSLNPLNSLSSISNSIPIPISLGHKKLSSSPLNRSNNNSGNTNNSTAFSCSTSCCSPTDIFERNVQSSDLLAPNLSPDLPNSPVSPPNFSSNFMDDSMNPSIARSSSYSHAQSHSHSQSPCHSHTNIQNSYLMSNFRPRHLVSENFTSPVLDSTVELISSQKFDDTDVVQVPHSRPSQNLFRCTSHLSNSSVSGPSTPKLYNLNQNQNQNHQGSLQRKSSVTIPPPSSPSFTYNLPKVNADQLQSTFAHSRSKSSLSSLSSPLAKSKTYNAVNYNSNYANINNASFGGIGGSDITKSVTNIDSPLVSPKRKSISFYSYLDLLNYERMSNQNTNPTTTANSTANNTTMDLRKQNEIYDAQEEADALRDLKNAQMIENQENNNILNSESPKLGLVRRRTYQGCLEDADARIDETLNDESTGTSSMLGIKNNNINIDNNNSGIGKNTRDNKHSNILQYNMHQEKPVYSIFGSSTSDINETNDNRVPIKQQQSPISRNSKEVDEDESIKSWVPIDDTKLNPDTSMSRSRRQSIVDELASLKSCTTNNSYFEDELQDCSTNFDSNSKIGHPIVNVCSANDYLHSRTRELRNSFVCNDNSLDPRKVLN